MFQRGVADAFLGKRKHFNQNFRSSGHFLAYIARPSTPTGELSPTGEVLYQGDFEYGPDGWAPADGATTLALDGGSAFSGRRSLKASRQAAGPELAIGKAMPGWLLDEHPRLRLAYRAPQGTSLGVRCQTSYNDWVTLGEGSSTALALNGDGQWHELAVDVREAIHQVLPGISELEGCQIFTRHAVQAGSAFWIDRVEISR